MSPDVLKGLKQRAAIIRERWEALLHVEPVNTALADPDTLSHLIPASLDQIISTLARPPEGDLTLKTVRAITLPRCGCNRNPYLSYFTAAEQALLEAVVLVQADRTERTRQEADAAEVVRAVRLLAASEIDVFCGICTHHGESPGCRHYVAAR